MSGFNYLPVTTPSPSPGRCFATRQGALLLGCRGRVWHFVQQAANVKQFGLIQKSGGQAPIVFFANSWFAAVCAFGVFKKALRVTIRSNQRITGR